MSITHTNNNDKSKAKFTFKPEGNAKEIKFKLIIVKEKKKFWIDIEI